MRRISSFLMIGACLILTSCASTMTSQEAVEGLRASSVPFGDFERAELKRVEIIPRLADHPANIDAKEKIDTNLYYDLSAILPDLKKLDEGEGFTSSPSARTLLIEPHMTDIRFIGTAARFWVGGMAGNSHVNLRVDFIDSETGSVIANPSFRREAEGTKGGWTVGASDRGLFYTVTQDVAAYVENNK